MKILYGGKILTEDGIQENKALVFDKKIENIIDLEDMDSIDAEKIPFTGILLPGFIDIHIHGAGGSDAMDGSILAMENISETIVKSGTTSFLATTMTMSRQSILKALDTIKEFMSGQKKGATCLGVHLEGPFINPEMKGAQDDKYIIKPDKELIKDYLDIIKLITLAPEMDEDYKFIGEFKDKLVLSIGHSKADYDTARESFEKGIKHVTHCFNAMTGLHHRNPGIVGAALASDVSIDMITDTIHVHKDLFRPIIKLKEDNFVAITDAMRAAFMGDGQSDLGGQKVYVENGKCTLEDGTIAGSVHQMDRALNNIMDNTDYDISKVSKFLSLHPAELLGIDKEKGSIKIGKDADLVVFDNRLVRQVYVGGEKA